MMLKKNVLVWLALLLLYLTSNYALNVRNVHAQDADVKLSVAPSEYYATKVGEVFQVNVTLEILNETAQVVGVDFRISYNNSLLEVVNVEEGPFFKEFTQGPLGTFFVYYVEDETVFPNGTVIPPHIIIGALIFPNETGQYPGPFPNGSGTIAMITFKAIQHSPAKSLNCTFEFFDIIAVSAEGEYLTAESEDGYYEIAPLTYEYSPRRPVAGQEVTFDASVTIEPEMAKWYYWQFDDGTTLNTTEQVVVHEFIAPGTYNVTLTVKYVDNSTLSIWKLVNVGSYIPLEVKIDAGSLYFRGEICEFNVITTYLGDGVHADKISAVLYFNGSIVQNLTDKIEWLGTGYYRIQYTIPGDAEAGTYTLLVQAKYMGLDGMDIKSFYISDNIAELKDTIDKIEGDIATIVIPDLEDVIMLNLTEINAYVESIDGTTATIESDVGTLKADVSDVANSILNLDGKLDATDSKIDDLAGGQGTMLTILYVILVFSIISFIAAILAVYFARKK